MNEIKNAPKQITEIQLPDPLHRTGPIHTLVEDKQSNIYYSDEINNSIVSLSGEGALRWQFNEKGSGPAQLHYPRGVAVGWIDHRGISLACLAVSDSWNHRIQFFSLEGEYLASWGTGGSMPFGEVSDIRYISSASNGTDPPGFWLALDRDNHRLCALGKNGRFLFQIGRPFPPHLEENWGTYALFSQSNRSRSNTNSFLPPYDFLFYPTRILGHTEDTLFVYESFSGRLKCLVGGNLIPLSVPDLKQWECVQAYSNGMALWSESNSVLRLIDHRGQLLWQGEINGVPVPSNSQIEGFWTQDGPRIRYWKHFAALPEEEHFSLSASLLRSTAESELEQFAKEDLSSSITGILDNTACFLAFIDSNKSFIPSHVLPEQQVYRALDRLSEIKQARISMQKDFIGKFHHWNLAMAARFWAFAFETIPCLSELCKKNEDPSLPFHECYTDLVRCADDLFVLLEKNLRITTADSELYDRQRYLFAQMETECRERIAWIRELWEKGEINPNECLRSKRSTTDTPSSENHATISNILLTSKIHTTAVKSTFLEEAGSISLEGFTDASPCRPAHLTVDPEGNIFVGAVNTHKVYFLDPEGSLKSTLGGEGSAAGEFNFPMGIALDSDGHLWVADAGNQRLQIFEHTDKGFSLCGVLGKGLDFGWLGGICPFAENSMLVADTLKYRIYRIYPEGVCDVLCDRAGSGHGEIRHPNSFCRDVTDPSGSAWIVDQKNNRLQKIDPQGDFSAQLGNPGLGKGSLLSPRSAAMFPDGMLVVAQEWFPELKLFTGEGDEADRLLLEYTPGWMTVHNDRLLVSQSDGNAIRIYRRL